jgi:hypothetical protein
MISTKTQNLSTTHSLHGHFYHEKPFYELCVDICHSIGVHGWAPCELCSSFEPLVGSFHLLAPQRAPYNQHN